MSSIRGKYNSTPPTVADGQWTDLQLDASGNLRVTDGGGSTAIATSTGAVDDAAVTNPANDGTVIALLKGILTALNAIETNTATP